MTPRERVRRAQRRLAATVVVTAILWAGALAMSVVAVAAVADAIVPLAWRARLAIIPLAVLAALAAAGVVVWRGRAARSVERVALWIEERQPALRYALVTAIDERIAPAARHGDLHTAAGRADVEGVVRHAWRRALGRALVVSAAAAALLFLVNPAELLRAAAADLERAAAPKPAAPMANRLEPFEARVQPPAYARMGAETTKDPSAVVALVGSRITFSGRGPHEGVTAVLPPDTLDATADGRRWNVGLAMGKTPTVVSLLDRQYRKLVILEPRPDSAPTVRLELPANDTTYQTVPRGRLAIEASIADDIGLSHGYIEYMLSTGAEESFETKSYTGARVPLRHERKSTLGATIALDTMSLAPGTVLHIRVVAFDFNDVSGPGKGVSETRTLRIAEPIDSTSINAAPPLPIDSMWVSQRLLNMRTDTLIRTKRRLERKQFVGKSSAYSNQQEDLRRRVLAVVSLLEDNGVGGSFETETSGKLRVVADLMWTARAHLGVAEPDTAMPYMKRILAILDEIRLAHRYYLRGLLRPVPVNIARVRLTGTDSAAANRREARARLADASAALARRIDAMASLTRTAPAAAIDSLTYIRLAALTTAPEVAATLGEAIEMLERGEPVDAALARTRRALEPPALVLDGPAEWGGIAP